MRAHSRFRCPGQRRVGSRMVHLFHRPAILNAAGHGRLGWDQGRLRNDRWRIAIPAVPNRRAIAVPQPRVLVARSFELEAVSEHARNLRWLGFVQRRLGGVPLLLEQARNVDRVALAWAAGLAPSHDAAIPGLAVVVRVVMRGVDLTKRTLARVRPLAPDVVLAVLGPATSRASRPLPRLLRRT